MLALFGLRGFFRGLFREVFSLLGLIAGFMIAVAFLPSAASYAAAFWKAPPLFLKGAVFVVIFFLVYFVFSLMGWLLHRSESLLFLKTVNRAGGTQLPDDALIACVGEVKTKPFSSVFLLSVRKLLYNQYKEKSISFFFLYTTPKYIIKK